MAATKSRRAWAIVDRRGNIHLDKIMATPAEAWGMLTDQEQQFETIKDAQANGYRCVEVVISEAPP